MIYSWNSTECKLLIEYLKQTCDRRTSEWFDKEVIAWFELNNVYGAVQNFNNTVRMITRLYIEPENRVKGMTSGPPVLDLIKYQLKWISEREYDNAFVSFDYNKRGVAKRHVRTAEKYGLESELLDGTYKTCKSNIKSCEQHIVLYRLSYKEFPLCRLT